VKRRPLRRAGVLASLGAGTLGGVALALTGYALTDHPAVSPSLAAAQATPSQPAPSPPGGASKGPVTVKGPAVSTKYGTVQVEIVKSGGRITSVMPLIMPSGGRSDDETGFSEPVLKKETLAAQSADIDTVSGASYTSAGWRRSLQGALDAAR
jgi:uncharacterized protein with FMN-binding domain